MKDEATINHLLSTRVRVDVSGKSRRAAAAPPQGGAWKMTGTIFRSFSARLVVLIALSFCMAGAVGAQDGVELANRRVTLQQENADIRAVLKTLFQSAGVNYAADQAVQGTVTVSLTEVSFRTALETVLRSAPEPLTYRVENGIYLIQPREVVEPREPSRTVKIILNFISADAALKMLGMAGGRLPEGLDAVEPNRPDNTLIALGSDEAIRELKELLRLVDILPRQIEIKTEAVLVMQDGRGRKHRNMLQETGRTTSGQPVFLKTLLNGATAPAGGLRMTGGRYTARIEPRINGDDSISMDTQYSVKLNFAFSEKAIQSQNASNRLQYPG
jgi:hypothetical protein